jgi:hypothetical protein
MANRIEYAVSATPIRTIAGVSGKYAAQDAIEGDINKTLGGNASIATGAADVTVVGFTAGAVAYGECPASGKLALGGVTLMDMVFIKNTGKTFSSATVLGDTTEDLLILHKEYSDTNFTEICRIPPGGAICLPNTPTLATDCTWAVESSGSTTIAVEFALIT